MPSPYHGLKKGLQFTVLRLRKEIDPQTPTKPDSPKKQPFKQSRKKCLPFSRLRGSVVSIILHFIGQARGSDGVFK